MTRAGWMLLFLVGLAWPAHAASPDGGAPETDGGSVAAASQAAPTAAKDDLDFDLLDNQKGKVAPAFDPVAAAHAQKLAAEVKTRRRVLSWHQGLGLATIGALALTMVLGTLDYVDKFGGGDYTGRYTAAHEGLSIVSTAGFTTTAILGLAAPTPYKKPIKADAALAHKVLMGVAAAAFIANLILGPISASKEGTLMQRDLAGAHIGIGYGSLAAMLGGWLTFVVK